MFHRWRGKREFDGIRAVNSHRKCDTGKLGRILILRYLILHAATNDTFIDWDTEFALRQCFLISLR